MRKLLLKIGRELTLKEQKVINGGNFNEPVIDEGDGPICSGLKLTGETTCTKCSYRCNKPDINCTYIC